MEFTLLWAALTGVGFIWVGTRLWTDGLPPKPAEALIGAATIGLIVGRLAAMAGQGINPITHPLEILLVRGGVDTGFASLGALSMLLWTTRRQTSYVDALAPAAVLGLAGWHAGCLWRSACLGTASGLPWALAEPGSAVTRHPVEIYTAIALAGAGYLVSRLSKRAFLRFGVALAAAGLIRLAMEPMRHSIMGGPVQWYLAAAVLGLAMAALGPSIRNKVEPAPT